MRFGHRKDRLPGSSNRLGRALLSRFIKNDDGVYAIEFALLALPFFTLLFMIFEVAFTILANQLLDNAVVSASRMIRTGQAHQQGFTADGFKQKVCDELSNLFDCDSYLHIDVRSYDNFGSANSAGNPVSRDDDGKLEINAGSMQYDQGNAGEIVVVRVYYEWPMISPISEAVFSDLANGRRLMAAVTAFKNEPFPW